MMPEKPSAAQQRVIDLMKNTGAPLVMRKYRTRESGDVRSYTVDGKKVAPNTARSMTPWLNGGASEIEAMGHVQVRRYTLPDRY